MRGIKQFLDLVGAATFNHVDPNERHMSSSSIPRFQPGPLAPIATITDSAYSTLTVVSTLPRVALEYAHVSPCVVSTMACATSRAKPGRLTFSRARRK